MARPAKPKTFEQLFTGAKQEEFLDLLRRGQRRGAAIDEVFAHLPPDKGRRRKMRDFIDGNLEFLAAVEDAELDALEDVEEALYQAAISGSVAAAVKWLEMKGATFQEHRGRPPVPQSAPSGDEGDPLYNVRTLDPRQRQRKSSE